MVFGDSSSAASLSAGRSLSVGREGAPASRGGDLSYPGGRFGEGSRIEGDLNFCGAGKILGELTGSVKGDGLVVVGDSGVVAGAIEAVDVVVSGTVHGSLTATSSIRLQRNANVVAGDGGHEVVLSAPNIIIEDGAYFEGRCVMGRGKSLVSQDTEVRKVG